MLSATGACRLDNTQVGMAPTASWPSGKSPSPHTTNVINISQPKPGNRHRLPVSILKKADSDTSSTCSSSSMVTCQRGCRLKVPNTQLNSHDCLGRLRQELNDAYGKIDDLEEQLKLRAESHAEKEEVLRGQIKRLRHNLGIGNLLEVQGETISLDLTRDNGTFGFKLLGRAEEDEGEEGVVISSLTLGCPAQKCGKIYIWDKIIEINANTVSMRTCAEVEKLIRTSPNTMKLVIMRTPQSTKFQPDPPTQHNIHCPSAVYSGPMLPPTLTKSFQPLPPTPLPSLQPLPPNRTTSLQNHQVPQQRREEVSRDQHSSATKHALSDAVHLPTSLTSHLISDEDFDRLSAVGVPEHLDSSHDRSSELSEFSLGRGSDVTDVTDVTDVVDIMGDAREYEEVRLQKDSSGVLGITVTYGSQQLLGVLFVDSVREGSPAHAAGKPLLHDQILKINGAEVGVDVMCEEAISLLTDEHDAVTLELARPKKHVVSVHRGPGQSLGMMVAVSKLEEDKSVIISTVDPSGLVARHGLFKGLNLHQVNDTKLHGLGLKRVVEILAGAVGDVSLTVFLHPSFSPYQPPRPPTPYPLLENGELGSSNCDTDEEEEEGVTERSVKFSLPPSPARSTTGTTSTTGSIDSLPRDRVSPSPRGKQIKYRSNSLDSSPRGRSPNSSFDYSDPRNLKPFPRGYGSPSINLINNDWSGSLDRCTDHGGGGPASPSFRTMKLTREQTKGPIRVTHQVIPTSILPMKVSLHNSSLTNDTNSDYSSRHSPAPLHHTRTSPAPLQTRTSPSPLHQTRTSPTPHPSINAHMPAYENIQPCPDYENIARYSDYKASPSPQRARVLGRRERAALSGDRKVQFGSFKPINPNDEDEEHYV